MLGDGSPARTRGGLGSPPATPPRPSDKSPHLYLGRLIIRPIAKRAESTGRSPFTPFALLRGARTARPTSSFAWRDYTVGLTHHASDGISGERDVDEGDRLLRVQPTISRRVGSDIRTRNTLFIPDGKLSHVLVGACFKGEGGGAKRLSVITNIINNPHVAPFRIAGLRRDL